MIKICYLAKLADLVGRDQEMLSYMACDTQELLQYLAERSDLWRDALSHHVYKIAVNKVIIHEPVQVHDGDEIALLPPVTGG